MLKMAYMLRPWVLMSKKAELTPRVLADDIMLLSTGANHQEKIVRGFEQTITYFADMGARISPKKSFLFSSVRTARRDLRLWQWKGLDNEKLRVANNARDLGAHATYAGRQTGTTLNDRAAQAAATADKAKWLPLH